MNNRYGAEPFIRYHRRYDGWFERHWAAYLSELLAIPALLPWKGRGLEIGVGMGRFASPLGVEFGIDPAAEMLDYAGARGVRVARAVGEALPFADAVFDYALIVTTICFLDDSRAAIHEAARVLRPGGELVIGFIDRESALGWDYLSNKAENVFYREAKFFSATEVEVLLKEVGFARLVWAQTLYTPLLQIKDIAPISEGTGHGAFVVVRAHSPDLP